MTHKPLNSNDYLSTWEDINPEKAQEYLDLNTENNRRVSPSTVDRYAQDMKDGRWLINGDPIRFTSEGKLIDGQHRLQAIVKSQSTIKTLVVKGLSVESMQTIDLGKKRTLSDIMQINYDIKNAVKKSAVTNALMIPFSKREGGSFAITKTLTEQEKLDLYFANQEGVDFSIQSFQGIRKGKKCNQMLLSAPPSAVIARAYYHEDHDRLQLFMEIATTGIPTSNFNPATDQAALVLNNYLAQMSASKKWELAGVIFRKSQSALKAFIEKRSASSLRETSDLVWKLKTDDQFISYYRTQALKSRK